LEDVAMWEPFLLIALLVTAWRWLTRRRSPGAIGAMPNVGDAPSTAKPIVRPELDDNGLATYSLNLPETELPLS
jgi:hypothetical protein